MKLTENQYNALLDLSYKYFKTAGCNPVNILLLDLISKEKLSQPIKISGRIKDYLKRKKNKFETLTINKRSVSTESPIDFLFFVNEPTHYNQLSGILRILKKDNKSFLVLTNKIKIFKQLQGEQINTKLISGNIDYNENDFTGYHANVSNYIKEVHDNKLFDLNDFDKFSNIIKNNSLTIFKYNIFFSALIEQFSPKMVIIGNDLSFFGRILASVCNENKINSTAIQHGTIPFDIIHKYHLVNKLFVFGKKSQDVLLSFKMDKERIEITGAPYLDSKLYDINEKNIDKLRKYFKLKKSDKVILVAFSGAGQRTSLKHHKMLIDAIEMLAQDFAEYKFLIKLHRKDDIKYYGKLKKSTKNVLVKSKIKLDITNDIFDWLKISDALITGNSAVATEAMLMKKPVITIDLMNEYPFMDFIDEGITLHSKTNEEVKQNLKKIINSKDCLKTQLHKQYDFINQYFYSPDGKTSRRCMELMEVYHNKISLLYDS